MDDVTSARLASHEDHGVSTAVIGDLFPVRAAAPPELVVIGDTGIDLFVAAAGMPERDSKVIGPHLGIFGGGMAANLAAAARGAFPALHVRLVSRVGGDEWGRRTLEQLVALGVDTGSVAVDPRSVTWWCAVGLDSSGEKALMGGRTPASLPTRDDFRPGEWSEATWLHVLGDVPWSGEAIAQARSAGSLTSVDIEGSFVLEHPERARGLASAADLPILNLSAVQGLGANGQDVADIITDLTGGAGGPSRPRGLLVTMGGAGSLFVHRAPGADWHCHREPARLLPVVDSTGAGDAFAGTLIASLLRGLPVSAAMAAATTAAAATIGRLGSRGPRLDHAYDTEEAH